MRDVSLGRIDSVSAITDTFIKERPIPTKMDVGHSGFEIGDEVGPVENEDYVAALVRFDNGAVGTRSRLASASTLAPNTLSRCTVRRAACAGISSVSMSLRCASVTVAPPTATRAQWQIPSWDQWAHFQPAIGTSMGFDDMKVVEAQQFLSSIATSTQLAPSAADAWCAAEVDEAVVASAADGSWHSVPRVTAPTTFDR